MKATLALSILSEVMNWDDSTCRREFAWLQLMAQYKFDRYRGFQPGVRFLESLVGWLQQFRAEHRPIAYDFLRNRLLYISSDEISHLVEGIYSKEIRPRLVSELASALGVDPYRVWGHTDAVREYQRLLRQCLFLGLSDGARIDEFRRVNEGIISNEQVTTTVQLDSDKWMELRDELRDALDDVAAKFRFVFLLDDFVASGTTFLRLENGQPKGKLVKFWTSVKDHSAELFSDDWVVHVVHYIASFEASELLPARAAELEGGQCADLGRIEFGYGWILPATLPVRATDHPFIDILSEYYDPSIETRHTGRDLWLGFKECALPLVLEHNTPNNSIALLWAESRGKGDAHAMTPLFRRRQRHVS